MTTRALALLCGFAACTLLTCDTATAQPPPPYVSWGLGYPKVYDPVGPPMPKSGGVLVYGTALPKQGWMTGNAGFYYVPKAGGVITGVPIDNYKGGLGFYDINTKSIIEKPISLAKGDYNVWLNVFYSRINPNTMQTEVVGEASAMYSVTVK